MYKCHLRYVYTVSGGIWIWTRNLWSCCWMLFSSPHSSFVQFTDFQLSVWNMLGDILIFIYFFVILQFNLTVWPSTAVKLLQNKLWICPSGIQDNGIKYLLFGELETTDWLIDGPFNNWFIYLNQVYAHCLVIYVIYYFILLGANLMTVTVSLK